MNVLEVVLCPPPEYDAKLLRDKTWNGNLARWDFLVSCSRFRVVSLSLDPPQKLAFEAAAALGLEPALLLADGLFGQGSPLVVDLVCPDILQDVHWEGIRWPLVLSPTRDVELVFGRRGLRMVRRLTGAALEPLAKPIQILFAASGWFDRNHPVPDASARLQGIRAALAEELRRGMVRFTFLGNAGKKELLRSIGDKKPHVLHILGHGGDFGPGLGYGVRLGTSEVLAPDELASAVMGCPLRLVVLEACGSTGFVGPLAASGAGIVWSPEAVDDVDLPAHWDRFYQKLSYGDLPGGEVWRALRELRNPALCLSARAPHLVLASRPDIEAELLEQRRRERRRNAVLLAAGILAALVAAALVLLLHPHAAPDYERQAHDAEAQQDFARAAAWFAAALRENDSLALRWAGAYAERRAVPPDACFPGDGAQVNGLAVSGDGRVLVFGGDGGRLCRLEPARMSGPTCVPAHEGAVQSVAMSADGCSAISGGLDGDVLLWSPHDVERPRTAARGQGLVQAVGFRPRGEGFLVAGTSGNRGVVRLLQAGPGPMAPSLELAGFHAYLTAGLSPDGAFLAAGDHDRRMVVEPLDSTGERHEERLPDPVHALAWAPDSNAVAVGGSRGCVYLLHRYGETWEPRPLECGGEPVQGIAFSTDGSLVVAAKGSLVTWWDVQTGHVWARVAEEERLTALAFLPRQGEVGSAVAAAVGGSLRVRTPYRRALGIRLFHPEDVSSLAFSSDGRELLVRWGRSALRDRPGLYVWDIATGERVDASGTALAGPTPAGFEPRGGLARDLGALGQVSPGGDVMAWASGPVVEVLRCGAWCELEPEENYRRVLDAMHLVAHTEPRTWWGRLWL